MHSVSIPPNMFLSMSKFPCQNYDKNTHLVDENQYTLYGQVILLHMGLIKRMVENLVRQDVDKCEVVVY